MYWSISNLCVSTVFGVPFCGIALLAIYSKHSEFTDAAGARVNLLVKEVITNASGFERSLASDSAVDLTQLMSSAEGQKKADNNECSQRLVIHSRHDPATAAHYCPICPANLCKVSLSRYVIAL